MDGPRSDAPAVAGLPAQRPPAERCGAAVLRSFGLDALVELVEGSPHGIGVTGEDGRWAYLNPAGRRVLGLPVTEPHGTDAGPGPGSLQVVVPATPAPGPAAEELQRQAARSAAAQERHRLGRDLHDAVSSALFALHARTQVVDRALAAGDTALLAEAAKDMKALSGQAIAELRALVSAMRDGPPAVEAEAADLPTALERLAATALHRDGMQVQLRLATGLPPVPPTTVEHLVRIAAEAVHNCCKHAGTDQVRVELEVRGSELVLAVADDGRGFDPSALTGDGHGQRTMRERAVLCGGWLHVDTAPGRGTRVVARVPLPG
jgi:signal transduction histidine kinase